MGILTSLQTLGCFKVRDEEGYRIVELGSLENLKGKLKIENLEKVQGEDESNKACLLQKSGIVELVLRWIRSRNGEVNDESVLRGLQPHTNLKKLRIDGFKGASFPSWTLKMEGLDKLMEIRLENCSKCEEIPTLGHVPHLKTIYLGDLENVKSISTSFYGIHKCRSNNVFPALETLELFNMRNLLEWADVEIPNGAEVKVFPCLKSLRILHCDKLKSAPSTFPCLKELYIDRMDSGIPLTNICGIKLTSLVKLKISSVGMVCLPDWLFHNNQNLSVFEIEYCPLKQLPVGLETLNSLEELKIWQGGLESIPFSSGQQSHGLTLLRKLTIGSGKDINVPCEFLKRCASSLKALELEGRVSNIPMIIENTLKMPHLAELVMQFVPKFIISSPTELGSLRNLKRLSFSHYSNWDSVSLKKAVDGILRMGPPSLQHLELKGDEDWVSLPDQLQHLTALEELWITDFGVEEMSEWFGNLSSLRWLVVRGFRKLKCQPFAEVIRRLTNCNFKQLNIHECPLLEKGGIEQQINVSTLMVSL